MVDHRDIGAKQSFVASPGDDAYNSFVAESAIKPVHGGSDARKRGPLGEPAREQHSGDHRQHKNDRGSRAETKRSERRPWTKADKTPADAKYGWTCNNANVQFTAGRKEEFFAKKRSRSPQNPFEAHEGDGNCASHDEGEACIPGPGANSGEIEKVEHLCRIGHAGQHQSEAEDQADCELENDCHDAQPICRVTNTVAIPAAMKVAVATNDRTDNRDSPHTAWPEVQPFPHTEPKPTRKPPSVRMLALA